MTSTPVVFIIKRSGLSSDRPSGTIIQQGEPAVCFGAADPGVYFEDSAGSLRKVGPTHYGTTAPNSTPVGAPGNSVGELWADSSSTEYYLKVWTGSAWQKVGAAFADLAANANITTATYAIEAGTAALASGAVLASGALRANTAVLSSGAVLASGSRTALLSSGTILASGALTAFTATLSSGTILASGALAANTATLSSGALLASGVIKSADIGISGLPDPTLYGSGALFYQIQTSGVYPAGLYIRFSDVWNAV